MTTTAAGPAGYRRLTGRRGWRVAVTMLAIEGLIHTAACLGAAGAWAWSQRRHR